MRTLEELKGRSRVEVDETGREHWLYAGCCTKGQAWVNYPDPETGKSRAMPGLRAAWLMNNKVKVGKGVRIVRVEECGFKTCVNPECGVRMTHKRWGEFRRGKTMGRPGQRLGGVKAIAARRVVTPELAAEILRSTESAPKVAALLGLKSWNVRDVRTGRNKMAQGPMAGMFSALVK